MRPKHSLPFFIASSRHTSIRQDDIELPLVFLAAHCRNNKKFFDGEGDICASGQINKEIVYFRDYYQNLAPACLIIYDRIAYFEPDGDLRLTIDHYPRYRTKDLTLTKSMDGYPLLQEGASILEIKVQQAMPLWLPAILSEGKIYKNSFSKYGAAYERQMLGLARKG